MQIKFTALKTWIAVFGNDLENSQENSGTKYIAADDAEEMKRQMSKYGDGYGTDWVMIPDGEGQPQLAVLKKGKGSKFFGFGSGEDSAREDPAEEQQPISEDVHFQLYTR